MAEQPRPVRPPPDTAEAAWRALALRTLLWRLRFQHPGAFPSTDHFRDGFQYFLEQLNEDGVLPHLSGQERRWILGDPAWTAEDERTVSWRTESFGVLLWALSFLPFGGSFDETIRFDPFDRAYGDDAMRFRAKARLRPFAEIEQARILAAVWRWRALQKEAAERYGPLPPDAGRTRDDYIRLTAEEAHRRGVLAPPIAGDFPAFGKAYRDLDEDEYAIVESVTRERCIALNWLCGYSADWDTTAIDL